MSSLESGIPAKRENGRTARIERQYPYRSRLSRFFVLKKLGYLQWICTVAVFFFFVVLFQMLLPGLVIDKSDRSWRGDEILPPDLAIFKEKGVLDFGEDVRFEPTKLMMKFQRETNDSSFSSSSSNTTLQRFGFRKPQLALVFANLVADPQQLLMVTVANALQETGYAIEVYSLKDGHVHEIWEKLGFPVTILGNDLTSNCLFDWLSYDGIIVNSLEARTWFSCVMQDPFKSLPLIWVIDEQTLAVRSRWYNSTGQTALLADWKKIFTRASVVVFHNYLLPIVYSPFDDGNFYVIPGIPIKASKLENLESPRKDEIVITIVGSEFLYTGLWLEHALILKSLRPLFPSYDENHVNSRLKVYVLNGHSASNYSLAIEAIARNLSYPEDSVKHICIDGSIDWILGNSDVVIYGSFLEEQSFPEILMKAMSFGKPVVAPDLRIIRKYVDDRVNGYLYCKDDLKALTQIVLEVMSKKAQSIGLAGKATVRNMMAREVVQGYSILLKNVLKFSSEVAFPKDVNEISPKLRDEWQWETFDPFLNTSSEDMTARSYEFLKEVEEQWNHSSNDDDDDDDDDDSFMYEIWEEERYVQMIDGRKRREEEDVMGRAVQYNETWEAVYKAAKKAERIKNELYARDEEELLRTDQPLCIYEPYYGEGTWPFLHRSSLYRGISLSAKDGRRPMMDDIDASTHLKILKDVYYRDVLGEFGAFFAISNRIDQLHKNDWIGFQSWRATARKESLSKSGEKEIIKAIEEQKHGDALYFWARMDKDPRNPLQKPFWLFCDSINAGNCGYAYNETLKRMYGVKKMDKLPSMPEDGDTWSVMQSWAMPTRSFLEFIMFSRMFVDSLDALMYEEHHQTRLCYLSLTRDKECYSRVLEVLVNVWAYHSGRRMVYVDPATGLMQEQHVLSQRSRWGRMWVKWFDYSTLKMMDEDLAEEADSDRRMGHWLWPLTGEIVWEGSLERERLRRTEEKEEKKRKNKEKLERIIKRNDRQKVIGKYVKSPPADLSNS